MTEPIELVCAANSNELESARIQDIHQSSGHFGKKPTLYFVQLVSPRAPKAAVREAVRNCDKFQSINPAPVYWKIGRLDVGKNWSGVEMDVTHWQYLTLINCSSNRFAIGGGPCYARTLTASSGSWRMYSSKEDRLLNCLPTTVQYFVDRC